MKKILVSFLLLSHIALYISAQTPNKQIPLSHQFYQKLNKSVYDTKTKFHSSVKSYFVDDSLIRKDFDSILNYGVDSANKRSWVRRKLTQEHLLEFNNTEYDIYADFITDLNVGREFSNSTNTWLNTRGYQIGGNIGPKFSFYTSGFENQGRFANYYTSFIDSNKVVPGQSGGTKLGKTTKDWSYVTAIVSYTPNKYVNFTLGYDKNFIGDGYRSMLLSDVSANYSFFRLRASLGSVQYQTIFAYMLDPGAPRLTGNRTLGDRGKWSAIHYIDWNATNRFSIGFFQSVTWADAEAEGKRGFDFNYIHPFVFLRPIESSNTLSPDKVRLGLNLKYELLVNTTVYGQFMLDEFSIKDLFSGNGSYKNKYALQLGVKGSNLFKVPRLNYLAEFNTARPYTYSHFNRLSNYSNYNQPLAHPFGANFREILSIVNYSYRRFDFQGQLTYAKYGLDPEGLNYGKNIFLDYETKVSELGNHIGQGIGTTLNYAEGKIAYLLNPKTNLRIELGAIIRNENNRISNQSTKMVTFGIRSSFRNLYADF